MRSTIVFLSMLLFVSAFDLNNKSDFDAKLIEISKDPSSEAVFATMATQLQTEGGFQRVLGLLNELVHDAKEQLHAMTKIWRGVHTRCMISKIKLAARQEFFENYYKQSMRFVRNEHTRLREVREHLKGFKKSYGVYSGIFKAEAGRYAFIRKHLKARVGHIRTGLRALAASTKEVTAWTPKAKALIQVQFKDINTAFLEAKDYQLGDITDLLEKSSDANIRKRLLEWLSGIRAQLQSAHMSTSSAIRSLRRVSGRVIKAIGQMRGMIRHAVAHLKKSAVYSKHAIKAATASARFYGRLARQNRALIAANRKYCTTESANFHKNQKAAHTAIKLFREIRQYFVTNYAKVHSYIKTKYHI